MKPTMYFRVFIALFLALYTSVSADSGGALSPQQAAYDVKYYALDLNIIPFSKTISGSLLCTMQIVSPIDTIVMDLNAAFTISSIQFQKGSDSFTSAAFSHTEGRIYIKSPVKTAAGEMVTVKIFYSGTPRVAVNPPWGDGFIWGITPGGKHWIGVACETEGGDVWWPCKDHPSDEPDSVSLNFTVPRSLTCVSNGRFLGSSENTDGTRTFRWFVSTPINNYNVTFYAAEYSVIEEQYQSVSGKTIPFYFWVLEEDRAKALNIMPAFRKEFDFLESVCGPFPFGMDKHAFAQAPYFGMEHQTVIAYGNDFTLLPSWGYDYIHLHELAHEWWGNLITAKDWSDIWIHEGIATYMEALYVEHLYGNVKLKQFVDMHKPHYQHLFPLAPREPMSANTAFHMLNPYERGMAVMHTLRFHTGDSAFFKLLKHWTYPAAGDVDNSLGRLCRIMSTEDMKNEAEKSTGLDLDPFFEVFFRQKNFPVLNVSKKDAQAGFTWTTENNVPLDLDVPVLINGVRSIVDMTAGHGTAAISLKDSLEIDPDGWLMMGEPVITTGVNDNTAGSFTYQLNQNYPNPFNPSTTITYSLSEPGKVELNVYDLLGRKVAVLASGYGHAGSHSVEFNAASLPSGTYIYQLRSGNFIQTRKMMVIK